MKTRTNRRSDLELIKASKKYKTKMDLIKKDRNLYQTLRYRELLEKAFEGRGSGRRRFVKTLPQYTKIFAEMLKYKSSQELYSKDSSASALAYRYGIDVMHFYDNLENPTYLKTLLLSIFEDRVLK